MSSKAKAILYDALYKIANSNHPDYPHFRGGTEYEFQQHLISLAQKALDDADTADQPFEMPPKALWSPRNAR